MTLNGVMAVTLCYFTELVKPAFQHITASERIKLIDQKSACGGIYARVYCIL